MNTGIIVRIFAAVQRLTMASILAGLALLGAGFAVSAVAGDPGQIGVYDVNVGHGLTFTGKKADAPLPLALRGYDTVSYFTDGKPQLGRVQFAVLHNGAIYWFASEVHRQAFEANPDESLPQYGGFCAYGVTQQTKFDGDPLLWNIYKGNLYLNVTPDLQKKWLGEGLINGMTGNSLEQNIADADRIWPNIRDARPQSLFEAWLSRQ